LINFITKSKPISQFKILEFVRDGDSVEQVQTKSKQILGRRLVQDGVERMVKNIIVEVTFHNGSKIVLIKKFSDS
jgi:urease gamma subunit